MIDEIREERDVFYWHRTNVARWVWGQCPKWVRDDTQARLVKIRKRLDVLAKQGEVPLAITGGLPGRPDVPWPRDDRAIVQVPMPLLKKHGLYQEACQTWLL